MLRVCSFVVRPALLGAIVLAFVFAAPPNASALVRESSGAGEAVPKRPTAREQLEYATRLKRETREGDASARTAARAAAVQAYRAVRELFPAEAATASEAAFRAGEVLRADGDTSAALAEFRWAREHGTGTPLRNSVCKAMERCLLAAARHRLTAPARLPRETRNLCRLHGFRTALRFATRGSSARP